MVGLKGWDCKSFALLASSFREALVMDADTVFVQDPLQVFRQPEYTKTGSLFFYDRSSSFNPGVFRDGPQWFLDLIPYPSETALLSRWLTDRSQHEQESGVVVLDKKKNLIGLLAACLMNSAKHREESYSHFWGDKETFWIGMELARKPYLFSPGYGGAAGTVHQIDEKSMVCGRLAHADFAGKLLWFNGGYETLELKSFSLDYIGSITVWAKVISGGVDCLWYDGVQIVDVTSEQSLLVEAMNSRTHK